MEKSYAIRANDDWTVMKERDDGKWGPRTRLTKQGGRKETSARILPEAEITTVTPELPEKIVTKCRNTQSLKHGSEKSETDSRIKWALQIFAVLFSVIATSILAGITEFKTVRERELEQTNSTVADENGRVHIFSGHMTVLNVRYQPALEDTSSEEFDMLIQQVCQEFEVIFSVSRLSPAYVSNDVYSIRFADANKYIAMIYFKLHFKNAVKDSIILNTIDSAYFTKANRPPVTFLIDSSSLRAETPKQNFETEDIVLVSFKCDNQVQVLSEGSCDVAKIMAPLEVLPDQSYEIKGKFERIIENPSAVPLYTRITFRLSDSKGHELEVFKHYYLNSGCKELVTHELLMPVQFDAADVGDIVDIVAISSVRHINSCAGRHEKHIVNDTATVKIVDKIEEAGTVEPVTTTVELRTTTTEPRITSTEQQTTTTVLVTTAADIDECADGIDNCEQICNNTIGSYSCGCNPGFVLDENGITCTDIDECADNTNNCNQTCTNTIGSFVCGCNAGFKLDEDNISCLDIDECLSVEDYQYYEELGSANYEVANCDQVCTNTVGSFVCSCFQGYTYINDIGDESGCIDINECFNDEAPVCNQICTNTEGSFTCGCNTGFELDGDGVTCNDINECAISEIPLHNCDQICTNTVGSFACDCNLGFQLVPIEEGGLACVDINECITEGDPPCGINQECFNTDGSFECTNFEGSGSLQSAAAMFPR